MVPEGSLSMEVSCSGLNYVICLLVITVAITYLGEGETWKKLAMGAAAPVVGVIANTLRVISNLLLLHIWRPDAGRWFLHDAGGVIIAVVGVVGMMTVAKVIGIEYRSIAEKDIRQVNTDE